jgi:hypothetical protein
MNRREAIERIATAITKTLMKEGRLIEIGFRLFLVHSYTAEGEEPTAGLPAGMGEGQYDQLRSAFFGGAQHLFGSLMVGLDPDHEVTEEDERRVMLIGAELDAFIADYAKRHGLVDEPQGTRQ